MKSTTRRERLVRVMHQDVARRGWPPTGSAPARTRGTAAGTNGGSRRSANPGRPWIWNRPVRSSRPGGGYTSAGVQVQAVGEELLACPAARRPRSPAAPRARAAAARTCSSIASSRSSTSSSSLVLAVAGHAERDGAADLHARGTGRRGAGGSRLRAAGTRARSGQWEWAAGETAHRRRAGVRFLPTAVATADADSGRHEPRQHAGHLDDGVQRVGVAGPVQRDGEVERLVQQVRKRVRRVDRQRREDGEDFARNRSRTWRSVGVGELLAGAE